MRYALQLFSVLAVLVEGPPAPGGDLTTVTDQEIIRALSVLLTQERRDNLDTAGDGVSFRRREQFDEEERKLMKLVESQRQQSLSESGHSKNLSPRHTNNLLEFIVSHFTQNGVGDKIDKIGGKKGSHPD